MATRLKTSKRTQEIFEKIYKSTHLQPFTLAKLAMALSIKSKMLKSEDFNTDHEGLDLNRQTIMSAYDELFKCLIEKKENRKLSDDEFFPKYVKAHIDRGTILLDREFRYGNDFYYQLLTSDDNI